jgi:glutathione-specific gamma-glutamylcyclotransferase
MIARAHPGPVADDAAAMALVPEEALAAGLDAWLAARPDPAGEVWLFAYGSLMWRPDFPFAESRPATVRGWHRRFCLWQWRFRGTRACPGVMLALDRGGACRGVAYRVAGPAARASLWPVWQREMRGRGYEARRLPARTPEGVVQALAFVANRAGERYAGKLSDAEIARRIAAACGHVGPSADYLLRTVEACEAMGIRDPHLWAMQALVAGHLDDPRP